MSRSFAPAFRRQLCAAILGLLFSAIALCAQANELPLISRSAMTGIAFEDRPLALPLQINFRMAMLSASAELGRSCGKMEAYGWRMASSEQGRVDQIFNATVEHMRHQGYFIQSEAPAAVSRDITIFTADRLNQHYIFMWSAGEVGLVMVICESSPPLTGRAVMAAGKSRAEKTLAAQDVIQIPPTGRSKPIKGAFTPVGVWKGEYTCLPQGYTGATLQISRMKGDEFEGDFHFYPTPKNPEIPEGRYEVYGQYDQKSHRILINPGKWLRQPKDYANSVMVGGFDAAARTISAYFQGVNGCTSFEAKYMSAPAVYKGSTGKKKKHARAKIEKHAPAGHKQKSGKAPSRKDDSLKSLKPVIIGGPGDQGSATRLPSTARKIDNDFSSALNSDEGNGGPYAKLEEEVPHYATEEVEKAPQDKTPAAQFYIAPSQARAAAKSLPEDSEDAGQSQKRNSLLQKFFGRKTKAPSPVNVEPEETVPYFTPSATGAQGGGNAVDDGKSQTFASPQSKDKKAPETPAKQEEVKPESALTPMRLIEKPIRIAMSGQRTSPQAPSAPEPNIISPIAPSAPGPASASSPSIANPIAPTASGPGYAALPVARNYVAPEAPPPGMILPPSGADIMASKAPEPAATDPRAPTAPEPVYAPDAGGSP